MTRQLLDHRIDGRRGGSRAAVVDEHRHRVHAAAARPHIAGQCARVQQAAGLQEGLARGGPALQPMRQRAVDTGHRQGIDEGAQVDVGPGERAEQLVGIYGLAVEEGWTRGQIDAWWKQNWVGESDPGRRFTAPVP